MNTRKKLAIISIGLLVVSLSWKCGLNAKSNNTTEANYTSAQELLDAPSADGKEKMSPEKEAFVMKAISEVIANGHYSPAVLNDAFAQKIFVEFMERLDFSKQLFTQQDINTFKVAIPTIDDQFKDGSTKFFDEVLVKYEMRKKEIQNYFKELIDQPFTFTADEKIELDGKKIKYAANSAELKDRWRINIKYRLLSRYNELAEYQNQRKDTAKNWVLMSDAKMLDSAKVSVKKNMELYFKNINKTTNADLFEIYVNSLTNLVDPHSEFFTPRSKQSFDEQMSGTFYGIGATLQMKENYCTVTSIVTGSPCFKQGSIKIDDKIIQVAQGPEEPIDVVGWDVSDIVKLIRGKKGTEVRLHMKHANGVDEIISLIRDEIKIEETFAKSAIIKYNNQEYGFIHLPEFYADFSKQDGKRCAADIKTELEKLKAENVKGIILDLRYNGGGSLYDVVEIGGYFLGQQPIVQVKSKDADAKALKPSTNNIIWDGPLVLLTNFASASASEILAGAIQDYNRGIVVGGKTFGKGTVQRAIDLDEVFNEPKHEPLGSLKLTLQKFYRVNGKSTQRLGVQPDVALPDLFMYVDGLESGKQSALPYDEVEKLAYEPINTFNLSQVISTYNTKVKGDAYYKNISSLSKKVKAMRDDQTYYLNQTKFQKQIKEITAFNKQLDLNKNVNDSLDIYNLRADMNKVISDTISKKKNEDWIKMRNKDQQIKDAVAILANIKSKQ